MHRCKPCCQCADCQHNARRKLLASAHEFRGLRAPRAEAEGGAVIGGALVKIAHEVRERGVRIPCPWLAPPPVRAVWRSASGARARLYPVGRASLCLVCGGLLASRIGARDALHNEQAHLHGRRVGLAHNTSQMRTCKERGQRLRRAVRRPRARGDLSNAPRQGRTRKDLYVRGRTTWPCEGSDSVGCETMCSSVSVLPAPPMMIAPPSAAASSTSPVHATRCSCRSPLRREEGTLMCTLATIAPWLTSAADKSLSWDVHTCRSSAASCSSGTGCSAGEGWLIVTSVVRCAASSSAACCWDGLPRPACSDAARVPTAWLLQMDAAAT